MGAVSDSSSTTIGVMREFGLILDNLDGLTTCPTGSSCGVSRRALHCGTRLQALGGGASTGRATGHPVTCRCALGGGPQEDADQRLGVDFRLPTPG